MFTVGQTNGLSPQHVSHTAVKDPLMHCDNFSRKDIFLNREPFSSVSG